MYELEVNHERLTSDVVPDSIRQKFDNREQFEGYAILPWEEHCTECAMPQCYQTCELYESRKDGKCRRFIGGISPVNGLSPQVVRVAFKRWGQLMAYANINKLTPQKADQVERFVTTLDSIVSRIPDHGICIRGRRSPSARMTRRLKQSIAKSGYFGNNADGAPPDYFLLEIYNPNNFEVRLSFVASHTDPSEYNMGYQELLVVTPGFNRITIDFKSIAARLDLDKQFGISLNPNILDESSEGLTLYFGRLTFVWAPADKQAEESTQRTTIKVVAWDLDNTLWDGILIEDGPENLVTRPGIIDIIKTLDSRGIINTVVSKNNPEDALAHIERIGLKKYLIYPRIGWGQKGQYIRELISDFNVGANTFAFVDDSPFERDEVKSLNPEVRVYDAAHYELLPGMPEFNPPLSTESHRRRELYQYEKTRKEALSTFDGEYLTFLKDCEIILDVALADVNNIDRIHELVQRTNQLNFSGNRYQREEIKRILDDERYESFIVDCNDKYGQYGTIGFAIFDKPASRLIDLMFSCRVQSKRVEHAFISFLLSHYKDNGHRSVSAVYKKNDRNRKAGAVFNDMHFNTAHSVEGVPDLYEFDLEQTIPCDNIIKIRWSGAP